MKTILKLSVRITICGVPIYNKVEYVSKRERDNRYKNHVAQVTNGLNGYSKILPDCIITYFNHFKKSVFYYERKEI